MDTIFWDTNWMSRLDETKSVLWIKIAVFLALQRRGKVTSYLSVSALVSLASVSRLKRKGCLHVCCSLLSRWGYLERIFRKWTGFARISSKIIRKRLNKSWNKIKWEKLKGEIWLSLLHWVLKYWINRRIGNKVCKTKTDTIWNGFYLTIPAHWLSVKMVQPGPSYIFRIL